MNPMFSYFGINDHREIRSTERFKKEIEPLFHKGFDLSYENNEKHHAIIVIGAMKDRAPDKKGMYWFACSGDYKGEFYRSKIIF